MKYLIPIPLFFSFNTLANTVTIKNAVAHKGTHSYSFDVTLQHADAGWEHYADKWVVETKEGKQLGERVLLHPHDPNPFTRSLSGVQIPKGTKSVFIKAHDKVHGWSDKRFEVRLSSQTN